MSSGAVQDSWLDAASPEDMRRIVDALYRVHHLHAEVTNRDGLLSAIVEQSKAVAEAEACSLLLYDGASDTLHFHVAMGDTGDQQALKRGVRLRMGQGIAGKVTQARTPLCVNDAQHDPRVHKEADEVAHFVTESLLAVPMLEEDRLVGVLEAINKRTSGGFTDFDERVLEMFSSLAVSVLARARLVEEKVESERMAATGRTVTGLSHYTKNLLAGVSAGMEFFDEGMASENVELLRQGWPVLRRSVERIRGVVEDMLAYSTPRKPLYGCCRIRTVCEEAIDALRGVSQDPNRSAELDLKNAPESWSLDERGICHCLSNLLVNAADAVASESGRVRLRVYTEDNRLVLEVEDNGPGVSEEHRYAIFEAFFSTKGAQGTGLGLAVTRKIVQEHGGTVSVGRSAELGGACVRIELPSARGVNDGES
jgi:two-component system, NtrC family, sensor kinase